MNRIISRIIAALTVLVPIVVVAPVGAHAASKYCYLSQGYCEHYFNDSVSDILVGTGHEVRGTLTEFAEVVTYAGQSRRATVRYQRPSFNLSVTGTGLGQTSWWLSQWVCFEGGGQLTVPAGWIGHTQGLTVYRDVQGSCLQVQTSGSGNPPAGGSLAEYAVEVTTAQPYTRITLHSRGNLYTSPGGQLFWSMYGQGDSSPV